MTTLQYLGISALFIMDLLGAVKAEVNTLVQREGQSVTLHTGLTGLQVDILVFWFFSNTLIVESQIIRGENIIYIKVGFPGRLQLDNETGSLTIRDLTLNNSGVYQLNIFKTKRTSQTFILTVYAPVPLPQVPQGHFLDSSSGNESCSVVCSVENRRDMTLSWYRGEERLNQTSSPDLSTNLSLPLEIKLQDKDVYSCVSANPVSNQTTRLNIETLCLQLVESRQNHLIIIILMVIILGFGLFFLSEYSAFGKRYCRMLCFYLRESRRRGAHSVRPCVLPPCWRRELIGLHPCHCKNRIHISELI